ncbi:MAG TPA: nuclear transport factor 2 family protein [Steroidobacteraceae bacterium]|nr:nuclear transport factor 2 family protein [Steroidobacteraceae bacterium]
MNEQTAVRAVVEEYVAAAGVRDVARLEAIFHPQALMSGYLNDQKMIGSLRPLYDFLRQQQGDTSGTHRWEIPVIEVTGSIASVTLTEKDFFGMDFTTYFHLVKLDGNWKIVSKLFTTV